MISMSSTLGPRAMAAAIAIILGATASAHARTYVVNDHRDHLGTCTPSDCTLREAVIAANDRPGGDVISMPMHRTHFLSIESTGEDAALDGDLDVTSGPLRIVHSGRRTAAIDAGRIDRVFDIQAAETRLEELTIRGGVAHPTDGDGDGGGVLAAGDARVTIADSRVVANRSPTVDGNGGGIDTDLSGRLRIVDTVIARNVAGGDGGGVRASIDGPTVIARSKVSFNRGGEGAGVMAVGPVTVKDSLVASNRALGGGDGEVGDGAGIYVDDQGDLSLSNSTVTENSALAAGGGLFAESGAKGTIGSATVARNQARAMAGGVHLGPAASFALTNSIVALNLGANGAGLDCSGTAFTNVEPNLVTTLSGGCDPGAEIVADPLLGKKLVAAQGASLVLPLTPGSPAIDAANPALSPKLDQRGAPRGADPDLGAYELR